MDKDLTFHLGGHKIALQPLPWRTVRAIQPRMFALNEKINAVGVAGLAESELDEIASVVLAAMDHATPGSARFTREEFDALPTNVGELMRALPAVSRAAGMIPRDGGKPEAASDEGK